MFCYAQQHQETGHLALPANILSAPIDADASAFHLDRQRLPAALQLMPPPDAALDVVASEIEQYEQIVIVIGRRALGCGPAIEELAERLGALIITSLDGKGIVDDHTRMSWAYWGSLAFRRWRPPLTCFSGLISSSPSAWIRSSLFSQTRSMFSAGS